MSLTESAEGNAEMGNGERAGKTGEAEDRDDAVIGNTGLDEASSGLRRERTARAL